MSVTHRCTESWCKKCFGNLVCLCFRLIYWKWLTKNGSGKLTEMDCIWSKTDHTYKEGHVFCHRERESGLCWNPSDLLWVYFTFDQCNDKLPNFLSSSSKHPSLIFHQTQGFITFFSIWACFWGYYLISSKYQSVLLMVEITWTLILSWSKTQSIA